MSASSTADIIPPIPSSGVNTITVNATTVNTTNLDTDEISYSYVTPPALNASNLGYTYTTLSLVNGTAINAPNVNQTAYTIASIPAGTYFFQYTTTLNAVQPDIQTYFSTTTGFTSNEFFLTGTNTQYESTTGSGVFTSTTAFTANVFFSTGAGGGVGTPIGAGGGGLSLTRIA